MKALIMTRGCIVYLSERGQLPRMHFSLQLGMVFQPRPKQ